MDHMIWAICYESYNTTYGTKSSACYKTKLADSKQVTESIDTNSYYDTLVKVTEEFNAMIILVKDRFKF